MSWFKRAPRPKNPPCASPPKHFSPVAERVLKETKDQVRGNDNSTKRGKHDH
jgi:hypothetical protein